MTTTTCPHCGESAGLYRQKNGSLGCIDCYWDQDDDQEEDQ